MSALVAPSADARLLPSGLESGTAPEDRKFRPDVEGLRAVAVLLVVLFHAGIPGLTGGYVGVDVFFVISGFVITGVLLRERANTGGTSILDFYARRVRRILPAATLLIIVVAFVAYLMLGYAAGSLTANDGRWAAVFLVNFHFTSIGTNYFSSSLPPSPLQNLWSLSVEEQFYVAFPTLIIVVAALRRWWSLRARLTVTLVVAIVASYTWSIVQTASHPTAAYFSPFTRAWELALGALIAVGTASIKKLPAGMAAVLTWVGLAAILLAGFTFPANNNGYPGAMVAVPVVGAALVIAGGMVVPAWGAERLLGLRPFRWTGRISYSFYLWHWPVLILVAEHYGKTTMGVGTNLLLLLVALAISVTTFAVFENPIRQMRLKSRLTVVLGVVAIAVTVAAMTLAINHYDSLTYPTFKIVPGSESSVVAQVVASQHVEQTPRVLDPPLATAGSDRGNFGYVGCVPGDDASTEPVNEPSCELGDVASARRMIVYGDSHALMWLPAFNAIAKQAHLKLSILGKPGCPMADLQYQVPKGLTLPVGAPFAACQQWNRWARSYIRSAKPAVLVVTQQAAPLEFTSTQWKRGMDKALAALQLPGTHTYVMGNIPILPASGPQCLPLHPSAVQFCSGFPQTKWTPYNHDERVSAAAHDATYIDPTKWFCAAVCPAIIGHFEAYSDRSHVTAAYAQYLSKVLGQTMGLVPTSSSASSTTSSSTP